MARWSSYRFTARDGTVSNAVLEQLTSGSTFYRPGGAAFVVPVPATCELIAEGIAKPAWGRDDPAPVSQIMPGYLTRVQLRKALHLSGRLVAVQNAIAAMTEPQKSLTQAEWDCEPYYERQHSLILALQSALSLTDAQVDNVFLKGATL